MIPFEIAQGITYTLLETTLASTAALLLVLLMRRRLRVMFGASVAYAAWLLVPIASIAVLLPAPQSTMSIPVAYRFVALPMQAIAAGAEPGIHIATWLCTAWLLGLVMTLLYFFRQQRRFRNALGRLYLREADVLQADATAGLPAVPRRRSGPPWR